VTAVDKVTARAQPALPGLGGSYVQQNRTRSPLNQTQFSWDEITARHPEMAEHADAVRDLAYGFDHEGMESEHDLTYRYKNVDPHKVKSTVLDEGRKQRARQGYRDGADVPPPLLVSRGRGGGTWPADGNHRIAAARNVVDTVRAVVASKK
jgi:hypothetical protein